MLTGLFDGLAENVPALGKKEVETHEVVGVSQEYS